MDDEDIARRIQDVLDEGTEAVEPPDGFVIVRSRAFGVDERSHVETWVKHRGGAVLEPGSSDLPAGLDGGEADAGFTEDARFYLLPVGSLGG